MKLALHYWAVFFCYLICAFFEPTFSTNELQRVRIIALGTVRSNKAKSLGGDEMKQEPWHDPSNEGNDPKYRNGETCVEPGCTEPAGTWWSPIWCQHHNALRMDRLKQRMDACDARLKEIEDKLRQGLTED